MLFKIFTLVSILSFFGCETKKFEKAQNSSFKSVEYLNHGQTDQLISALGEKEDLAPRERYYLASALSQKGGVDVISLYSVLEIQLFRKSALEWSSLSKEKNPYLKFMKSQEGIDKDKKFEKRKEKWEKYLPKIIEKHNFITTKPTLDDLKDVYGEALSMEDYELQEKAYQKIYDEVAGLALDLGQRFDKWQELENIQLREMKNSHSWYELSRYYFDLMHLETLKESYLYPEKKTSSVYGNVEWEMVYMNVLWNTYEAIPLMKELPNLTPGQQDYVTQALDQYRKLLGHKEFRDVALKNIAVLAGISLLSIYKSSLDLDSISSIKDVLCSFEPLGITNNYHLIRKRLFYLADLSKESGLEGSESFKTYQEHIKGFKESLPDDLTDEQREKFIQNAEDFKVKSCFNA
jgi:hypothetical protein